jgi:hypothetical protein
VGRHGELVTVVADRPYPCRSRPNQPESPSPPPARNRHSASRTPGRPRRRDRETGQSPHAAPFFRHPHARRWLRYPHYPERGLPARFVKIRHYGLVAAANVGSKLETARRCLLASGDDHQPAASPEPPPSWRELLHALTESICSSVQPAGRAPCGAARLGQVSPLLAAPTPHVPH